MEKHTNTCKEELALSVAQKSIESFFSPSDKNRQRLINSTKRELTNILAEYCALDSLPLSFVNGVEFKN